jgi:hypothetical protein
LTPNLRQGVGVTKEGGRQGHWLRLREAAATLGVSERTLRRRLRDGSAEGRRVSTPFGVAWEVWTDDADPTPSTPVGRRNGHADPALLEALRLIERLQADSRAAEQRYQQQLLELSGRAGYFQAQLEQARETIRALEAPKAAGMAQEPTPSSEAAFKPAARPWWRFW